MNGKRSAITALAGASSLLLILQPAPLADEVEAEEFAGWVVEEGGDVVKDGSGRITDVYLGFTWTTDADLERTRPLSRHIQRLDLSLTYISDRGMEQLRSFTRLEDLNLFAAEYITDAGIACLRGNETIERLNLRGTDITDISMEYIATMTNLRSLDVSFTQLNDTGLDRLAPLSRLEELVAGGNKITGTGLRVLRLLPKLRSLDLKGVQRRNAGSCWAVSVTDRDLELIGSLARLEELDLGRGTGLTPGPRFEPDGTPIHREAECRIMGGIRITDLGIEKLKGLKHLRSLDISGSAVTVVGLELLAFFPELEHLSLWGVDGIDDTAAPRLTALTSLRTLDLTDTLITDETLDQLASMDGLRRLYVASTGVTPEGVESFRTGNPDCQISWRSGLDENPTE